MAHQILRNRFRDYLETIRRFHEPSGDRPGLVSEIGMPQADLERSELRWMLRSVLARLPGSRREALLLEQLHGHAYDEISEILEASVSAVKMRVHPARELLQAHIERKIEGANSTDGVTADATRSSSMVEAFRTTFSKRLEA